MNGATCKQIAACSPGSVFSAAPAPAGKFSGRRSLALILAGLLVSPAPASIAADVPRGEPSRAAERPAFASPAARDSGPEFFIAGAASVPEYMGSRDSQIVPLFITKQRYGDWAFSVEGLTATLTHGVSGGAGKGWFAGFAMNVDGGREPVAGHPVLGDMREIEPAINAGLSMGYRQPDLWLDDDALELELNVFGNVNSVHDGQLATLNLGYSLPVQIPWRFAFELETSWGDAGYMTRYFGVDAGDAQRAGVARRAVGGSLRDVSLLVNIGLFFSRDQGLFLRAGISELLDEAGDAQQFFAGETTQTFVGLGYYLRLGE